MTKTYRSNVEVYATCMKYFISMLWDMYTKRLMTMEMVLVRIAIVSPLWSCSTPLLCASMSSKFNALKSATSHTSPSTWKKNSNGYRSIPGFPVLRLGRSILFES